MVKPFNELSGLFGALVVLERAIGQQNEQGKEKRHVNVRTPVPEIEQGTPYPPEGGGLQSPCFDHGLCRLNGVTLRPAWPPGQRLPPRMAWGSDPKGR